MKSIANVLRTGKTASANGISVTDCDDYFRVTIRGVDQPAYPKRPGQASGEVELLLHLVKLQDKNRK